MTNEFFENLLSFRLAKIKEVLSKKAEEYASGGDRLHNFKVAARIGNTTPEKALFGMAMKHLVSVMDLIEKPETATTAMVDEKVGDLINYLVLLEAIFKDHKTVVAENDFVARPQGQMIRVFVPANCRCSDVKLGGKNDKKAKKTPK